MFRAGLSIARQTTSAGTHLVSRETSTSLRMRVLQTKEILINKWQTNVPKGFKRYFPENGGGSSSSGATSAEANAAKEGAAKAGENNAKPKEGPSNSNSSNSNSSGGNSNASKKSSGESSGTGSSGNSGSGSGGASGSGKKGPDDFMNMNGATKVLAGMTVGLMFVSLLSGDNMNQNQTSWLEFRNVLLPSGKVTKIEVVNNSVARVYFNDQADPHHHEHHHDGGSPFADHHDKSSSSSSSSNNGPGSFGYEPRDRDREEGHSPDWSDQSRSGASDRGADSHGSSPVSQLKKKLEREREKHGHDVASILKTRVFHFNIGSIDAFERRLDEAQKELSLPPDQQIPVTYVKETNVTGSILKEVLPAIISLAIPLGILYFMTRGEAGGAKGGLGFLNKLTKSPAKRVQKEKVKTRFKDVAGCTEAKKEIMEFVEFLKDSKKFTDLGAKIPKGALLVGPPGTGKTMLARAVAGEADVPFFTVSGSDFIEMFVGMGSSRVRELFAEARANSPSIIFIDEIDAVGRKRGKGGGGANDERESTLNQLLVEMDGFDNTSTVVVLASTNRVDILDTALTRPGRFDRQVQVEKPDIDGRKEVFEVHLRNIKLNDDITAFSSRLAALTPGFSGADIANVCNEAAIIAARTNKTAVGFEDFETATERIIGGLESRKIMTPEEKRIVAYHEAGHAVAGWYLKHADPLLKVTIVPRSSGALGFAQYLPKELYLRTREQLNDMICMALAGRASEQVNFGRVTTGAADDLRRVTQILYQMVQVYGMNEKVGQVAFPREDNGWPSEKPYSNATSEIMDVEVRSMVDEAYARTLALVTEKQEQIKIIAEFLMEKETITNADVTKLIGAREFVSKEYTQYVEAGAGWENNKKEKEDLDHAVAAKGGAEVAGAAGGEEVVVTAENGNTTTDGLRA